ncbi:AI-2E family transporter [Thaumasiovibrio subtropicus]|uniref:AI-2E family transporter n=1 Tax=Thaumasiovibrio subtropicus TaxID=1891207 RepID=UPI000B34D86A|nr:AI-2E family transporter [Thaumasiovibrio subtropicus]
MSKQLKVEPRHWILIGALLVAVYASYRLVQPYLGPIVMAFILSLLFYPVHDRIEKRLGNKQNLASLASCSIMTFIIVIPVILVLIAILNQGVTFSKNTIAWLGSGGAQTIVEHPYVETTFRLIDQYSPLDGLDPQNLVEKATTFATSMGSQMLNISAKIVGDVTNLVINFILMLFILFFLLRDHEKIVHNLRLAIPLSRSQEDVLLDELENISKSAILGSFLTAIAQGLAGGFAMWLVGFPGLFWGTMMAFASFIPVVGTALIWVPTAIYLLLIGSWEWAAFMAFWGAVVVGSIDNLLRPFLMQGNSGMNTLLIFFSIMGGLQLFGLLGLIYGPIIFALTIVLFKLYQSEFKEFLEKQDTC